MNRGLLWGIAIVFFVALVGGFFLFSGFSDDTNTNQEGIVVVDIDNSQATQEIDNGLTTIDTTTDTDQEITPPIQETKEFDIIARQWEFSPNPITVNEGDKVILNIQSIDVTHGFILSAFGVSERLTPGQTTKVEFTANKKGSFSFFCNVVCGSGHSSMRGTLIVN